MPHRIIKNTKIFHTSLPFYTTQIITPFLNIGIGSIVKSLLEAQSCTKSFKWFCGTFIILFSSSTDPDRKPELNPLKMNILFLCMINNILFKFNKSFKKITNVPNFVKLNDILANKNKIIAEGVVKRIFMKMLIRWVCCSQSLQLIPSNGL